MPIILETPDEEAWAEEIAWLYSVINSLKSLVVVSLVNN